MKINWKLRVAEIKSESAQEAKKMYLEGSTILEIMEIFDITKKTFYDWVNLSLDEQTTHMTQLMAKNKMGRPAMKVGLKRAIKIKDVANAKY